MQLFQYHRRSIVLLLGLAGCAPLSGNLSPRVLSPGKYRASIGVASTYHKDEKTNRAPDESSINGELALTLRRGLLKRLDAGISLYGFAYDVQRGMSSSYIGGAPFGDLKISLFEGESFLVSADLGLAATISPSIHPAILFGTDRVFGGIKSVNYLGDWQSRENTLLGGFAAYSFGNTVPVTVELGYFKRLAGAREPIWVPGISVGYKF